MRNNDRCDSETGGKTGGIVHRDRRQIRRPRLNSRRVIVREVVGSDRRVRAPRWLGMGFAWQSIMRVDRVRDWVCGLRPHVRRLMRSEDMAGEELPSLCRHCLVQRSTRARQYTVLGPYTIMALPAWSRPVIPVSLSP